MNNTKTKKKKESQTKAVAKRLFSNPAAILGLVILCALILCAVFADLIAPYDYTLLDISNAFATPSAEHWFGTDELGRDILSRIIYGARYSLAMGFATIAFSLIVGMAIGSIAGYFGGWVDNIIMRICDLINSIPGILLTITLIAALGTGLDKCIIACSVNMIPGYVRMLRASMLSVRENEYLEAAAATNCSVPRIIIRYMLPNSIAPIIVQATMNVGGAIMTLSSLSFLGLGIQPPNPEWGAMLSSGRNYIRTYPHLVIFPGIFIAITILSLNLLGDGLRDALDPKLKS